MGVEIWRFNTQLIGFAMLLEPLTIWKNCRLQLSGSFKTYSHDSRTPNNTACDQHPPDTLNQPRQIPKLQEWILEVFAFGAIQLFIEQIG